jgi:hypothetical protein
MRSVSKKNHESQGGNGKRGDKRSEPQTGDKRSDDERVERRGGVEPQRKADELQRKAAAKVRRQTEASAPKAPSKGDALTRSERALEDGEGFYRPRPGKMGRPRLAAATMPIFDSIAQCAASTGVPATALKMAKSNGCQAFRSNRVDFGEFVRWWFGDGEKVDSKDWSKELKRVQALRESIKLEEDQRESISFGKVARFLQGLVGNDFFGELERLCQEWPPALKGLDEAAIHAAIVGEVERMKVVLRARLAPWEIRKPKSKDRKDDGED